MIKLVFLRHGQSTWNKENRFTGWTDVLLTEQGKNEAKKAGKTLKENGFKFDIVVTSVLKRALDTTDIVIKEMKLKDVKIIKSWEMNERHYGALQGLNKSEMAQKYGEEQVHIWRRSYDVRPPALDKQDKRWPGNDSLYKNIPKSKLPLTECLKDNVARTLPYWKKNIVPLLKQKKKVLISTHGNSLRALVKYLDKMSGDEIVKFEIPTGIPLVYELDDNLKPIKRYFLASKEELEKAVNVVKQQGKAKK
ncbi:MAG: 2,3-diphosphoglycerate-dependent phosphoglycerate mutase [Nanoarchaeota archaeon]